LPLKAIFLLFFGFSMAHTKAMQILTTGELNPHIFVGNGVEYFKDKTPPSPSRQPSLCLVLLHGYILINIVL